MNAPPASCCTRRRCRARTASATSARRRSLGRPLARAGQRGGRCCRWARPGPATRRTSLFAFAGNILLISPDVPVADGLLAPSDLRGAGVPGGPGRLSARSSGSSTRLLDGPGRTSGRRRGPGLRPASTSSAREQAGWLDDYALFMALKDPARRRHWLDWPAELVRREPAALDAARRELADGVALHQFGQFLSSARAAASGSYARARGVRLIGDLPIFVSPDSADVWANPHLFLLDEPAPAPVVAGVPPDYFSATGQLWGNPLYDWEAMRRTGFRWWVDRMRALLAQVDLVRLDHFRGFEAAWDVPAGAADGRRGPLGPRARARSCSGPPASELGGLPLIAEDLGLITPDVRQLRDEFGLPGMRVLQFAFGGDRRQPVPAAQLTSPTPSSTPARTTTTRRAAGTRPCRRWKSGPSELPRPSPGRRPTSPGT